MKIFLLNLLIILGITKAYLGTSDLIIKTAANNSESTNGESTEGPSSGCGTCVHG